MDQLFYLLLMLLYWNSTHIPINDFVKIVTNPKQKKKSYDRLGVVLNSWKNRKPVNGLDMFRTS